MTRQSLAASFRPFRLVEASLSWTEREIVVQQVDAATWEDASAPEDAYVQRQVRVPLDLLVGIRAVQPWPAVELSWRASEEGAVRQMLVHPRGLSRLVPASDAARSAFDRFASSVTHLFDHVTRFAPDDVELGRGWLDDVDVTWTRHTTLPDTTQRQGGYREAAQLDRLEAHALVERSCFWRLRVAVRRELGELRDPMPTELAISERAIWFVDEARVVWSVPRQTLRAVYEDDERIACIFGRSAFLAMSIAHSPIRTMLVEVAERVIAQNRGGRE